MKIKKMKVAIVTVDGKTVSQHFGRSPYYRIINIDGDKITDEGLRQRGTGHFARSSEHTEQHNHLDHQGRHGFGTDADAKHATMAQEIADCDVLVAGGMGTGAYQSFVRSGLKVYLTDKLYIDEVVNLLAQNKLENLAESRID
jgi:predicted Fe-Mo cluster-binding NifX family protein